jgi:hypothetical protein
MEPDEDLDELRIERDEDTVDLVEWTNRRLNRRLAAQTARSRRIAEEAARISTDAQATAAAGISDQAERARTEVIAAPVAAQLEPDDADDDEAQYLRRRIGVARARLTAAEGHQVALQDISHRTRLLTEQLRASAALCQQHTEQARQHRAHVAELHERQRIALQAQTEARERLDAAYERERSAMSALNSHRTALEEAQHAQQSAQSALDHARTLAGLAPAPPVPLIGTATSVVTVDAAAQRQARSALMLAAAEERSSGQRQPAAALHAQLLQQQQQQQQQQPVSRDVQDAMQSVLERAQSTLQRLSLRSITERPATATATAAATAGDEHTAALSVQRQMARAQRQLLLAEATSRADDLRRASSSSSSDASSSGSGSGMSTVAAALRAERLAVSEAASAERSRLLLQISVLRARHNASMTALLLLRLQDFMVRWAFSHICTQNISCCKVASFCMMSARVSKLASVGLHTAIACLYESSNCNACRMRTSILYAMY